MPEPTRQYIFTERQIKGMFAAVTVLMVVVLAGLLLLITARPQGSFAAPDTRQHDATLAAASEELSGNRVLDDGTARIDIDRAIQLVAERGVSDVFADAQATAQAPTPDAPEDAAGAESAALPDGATVYGSCTGCHQANGQGVPGAFPPVAGHAADLYTADPAYLAQVVLFGLQGPITVDGAQYSGLMPAWGGQLSDGQIAAVLNYMLSNWGNEQVVTEEQPYSAEDIAEQRGSNLSMSDVHARRGELDLP